MVYWAKSFPTTFHQCKEQARTARGANCNSNHWGSKLWQGESRRWDPGPAPIDGNLAWIDVLPKLIWWQEWPCLPLLQLKAVSNKKREAAFKTPERARSARRKGKRGTPRGGGGGCCPKSGLEGVSSWSREFSASIDMHSYIQSLTFWLPALAEQVSWAQLLLKWSTTPACVVYEVWHPSQCMMGR